MPNALVEKVSRVGKIPKERAEYLWQRAKEVANDQGYSPGKSKEDSARYYSYVVGIYKHMITKKTTAKLKWKFPERWTQKASVDCFNEIDLEILQEDSAMNNRPTNNVDRITPYNPLDISDVIDFADVNSEPFSGLSHVRPQTPENYLTTDSIIKNPLTMFSNSSFSLGNNEANNVIHVSDTDLTKTNTISLVDSTDTVSNNQKTNKTEFPIDAGFWLPLAASHYNISKNLNDYIIMPVPAMVSDIPNTNGDSVALSELLEFSATAGMPAFKTFKGKGVYIEHNSADPKQAKGVILDVYLRPLKGFADNKHAKLIELLAFDKTKDKELCSKIDSGQINTVSIGIYYQSYSCSICGNRVSPSEGKPCSHTHLKCRTYLDRDSGQLVYRHCHKMFAFETSVVADPAYVSAIGTVLRPSK